MLFWFLRAVYFYRNTGLVKSLSDGTLSLFTPKKHSRGKHACKLTKHSSSGSGELHPPRQGFRKLWMTWGSHPHRSIQVTPVQLSSQQMPNFCLCEVASSIPQKVYPKTPAAFSVLIAGGGVLAAPGSTKRHTKRAANGERSHGKG